MYLDQGCGRVSTGRAKQLRSGRVGLVFVHSWMWGLLDDHQLCSMPLHTYVCRTAICTAIVHSIGLCEPVHTYVHALCKPRFNYKCAAHAI